MKTIKIIFISMVMTMFYGTVSAQDKDELPKIDFKNEKFSDIKTKLERYMQEKEKDVNSRKASEENEEGESEFKHLNHWISEMENHLDKNGFVADYMKINWDEYLKTVDQRNGNGNSIMANTGGNWNNLPVNSITQSGGLVGWGEGRTNCLAIDPSNHSIIYAGAIEGGVWKTTNSGADWKCITNNIPVPAVTSIVINPSNSNNIFILTGIRNNNFISGTNTISKGVLVTYDGGNNWFTTPTFPGYTGVNVLAKTMRMSPTNTNVLLVTTNYGIFRTIDGGVTWAHLSIPGDFFDLEFKPGTSKCYISSANTIYVINDVNANTVTWNTIPNSNFDISPPTDSSKIVEVAVTPANSAVIYLYYYAGSSAKIYRSGNNGTNFILKKDVTSFANYQKGGYGGYNSALAVSPNNASTVYLGNLNVSVSTNSGVDWTTSSSHPPHADQHDLLCLSSLEAYNACDGGVFHTTDGGNNWTLISLGINNGAWYGFGGYPQDPNLFVGGTWDNGWWKYSSGAIAQYYYGDGGEGMIKATDNNTFYFVTENDAHFLKRTTDGGATQNDITAFTGCNCVDDNIGGSSNRIIQQNPLNSNTIYSMYRNFYYSYDGGTNWNHYNTSATNSMRAFAQGTNDTTRFYAVQGDTIWGSSNSGFSWIIIGIEFTATRILDITVNPANKNEFYFVCAGNYSWGRAFKGVWTGLGLATITDITSSYPAVPQDSLPAVPVYKVVYQNTSSPGIYAGTDIGVYFRSNATGHWELFSNGLPFCHVTDLEINYASNVITAATYGRGLWQSPLYSGCPVNFDDTYITLFGQVIPLYPALGQEYFEASNSIHANIPISGGIGTDVIFNAGNYVSLTDTFEVKAGSEFYAYIRGCTNPVPAPLLIGNYAGDISEYKGDKPLQKTISTSSDFNLQIAPNPTKDNVEISYQFQDDGETSITMLDVTGRMVNEIQESLLMSEGTYQNMIDLSEVINGIYFIKIIHNGKNSVARLAVAH